MVQSLNSSVVKIPFRGGRRNGVQGGFTLVETMVATVLLAMIILSILAVLIGSYRVAAKARYADHARYVIKSFADQFLTQQPLDNKGNTLVLFQPTVDPSTGNLTPLGTGLAWTNSYGIPGQLSTDSLGLYYYVLLADSAGGSNNAIFATYGVSATGVTGTVTRTVQYVYSNSGVPTLIVQSQSAGYLLLGTFTITYPYQGQTMTQSINVVRSIP
jgi:type II secretory pathway pseudopilin PulG